MCNVVDGSDLPWMGLLKSPGVSMKQSIVSRNQTSESRNQICVSRK